ncbi:hypothetical protein UlMin_009342 [Ulmus minor]
MEPKLIGFWAFDSMLVLAPLVSSSSSASASSPQILLDDNFEEDFCSICLESFGSDDPATVTSCKHEYHLHCILEWSQRSKECPICWQLLVLKDPASQGLLAAVQGERRARTRNTSTIASPAVHYFRDDDDSENESFSDEFILDEHVMQHLAAAASRARIRGRERQRSSGLGASEALFFSSPLNFPGVEQAHTSSLDESPTLSDGSSVGNSPTSGSPSTVNAQPSSPAAPSVVNVVPSIAANDGVPFKPRVLYSQPPTVRLQRPSPSEISTFSESIKSKWSAASARYKESISKSTRGLKEKLLNRNTPSVKELSKGVQREMSAGIAGVQRMIERLDLTPKRAEVSPDVPTSDGNDSNISRKGKGLLENIIVHSLNRNSGKVADDLSLDETSHPTIVIPGRVEVSRVQVINTYCDIILLFHHSFPEQEINKNYGLNPDSKCLIDHHDAPRKNGF